MDERITDIHMHIVPGTDDGSYSTAMSIEMLKSAYEQGVRSVFCTSHSWDTAAKRDAYLLQFERLRDRLALEKLNIELLSGNEVLFVEDKLDITVKRLADRILLPLNGTRYVLTEFFTSIEYSAAERIVKRLIDEHWIPVIAHAERYQYLTISDFVDIADMGCLIQINAYSLKEEHNSDIKDKAQELLRGGLASFIGSDAHGTDYRPPRYTRGVQYILSNCDAEYAEDVLYKNAEKYLK